MGNAYREAGVDINAGNAFVEKIKPLVKTTFRPEVLTELGGFGGLFGLDREKYKEPVLVSGTDGVGTKLKVAFMMDRHDTIGIDLVAMCVNDIVVTGAEPLFFLDYFATGKLQPDKAVEVVKGISEGCRQAGCALIGGETAEMPSMYSEGEYDLAGFAVGIAEKSKIIDGRTIRPGDIIVGLESSGLHSNGYSLARKIVFDQLGMKPTDRSVELDDPIGEILLTPTRIYVKPLLKLLKHFDLRALAHITGGGITENLPRVLPEGCQAKIRKGSWPVPPIFPFLQKYGKVSEEEMYCDFNMGIGMIAVVPYHQAEAFLSMAPWEGEKAYLMGEIIEGDRKVTYV